MKRVVAFIGIFILFVLGDFLLYSEKVYLLRFYIPGFFAVFGFVVCLVIILISKLLGHYWLQRKEDYYDRNDK